MTYHMLQPMRPATHDEANCEAVLPNGKSCTFLVEDGTVYCRKHRHLGPNGYQYAMALAAPSIPNGQLFDLTAEVRLLKQVIAARAAMIRDDDSLIIYSGHLADLASKSQKLVEGAVKLEQDKHNLISRNDAMGLIGTLMQIVAEEVKDVATLDKIYQRLDTLTEELDSPSD